ncbi:MAG TPA: minor capsid protein [Magnetospirillum sp.]|nr:minor capsid protein [Magnetospirillum sp.]
MTSDQESPDQSTTDNQPVEQADTPEDILLALLLGIDALATESGARMARHVTATKGRLIGLLAANPSDSALSASQVLAVRPTLQAEARELPAALEAELSGVIKNTSARLNTGMADVVAALQASGDAPAGEYVGLGDDNIDSFSGAEFDGKTWDQWVAHTGQGIVDYINRNLATIAATGATVGAALTLLSKLGDGLRTRAAMLASSAAWDMAQRGILTSLERNGVDRVMFSAVLDSRTSETCRSLHGRVWEVGSPAIRRPPLHPRCRSTLIPYRRGLTADHGGRWGSVAGDGNN